MEEQKKQGHNPSTTTIKKKNQILEGSTTESEGQTTMLVDSTFESAPEVVRLGDTNAGDDQDCVGLGLFFDDKEISALDLQWEKAAAQVREDVEVGISTTAAPPSATSDAFSGLGAVEDPQQQWIPEPTIREQDAIINHPRRPNMVGQTAWLELRGPRRTLSDEEATQMIKDFETTDKLLQHKDTLVKPRLLYRERFDGPDGKKQYKYRMASIQEIRTNVNAKRSTKLAYQNSDSSSVMSSNHNREGTTKLHVVNKPTLSSSSFSSPTPGKHHKKAILTRGDSETTAASSITGASPKISVNVKKARKHAPKTVISTSRSAYKGSSDTGHDDEVEVKERRVPKLPFGSMLKRTKKSTSKSSSSSEKMTLRSIISWYSDLLDDLEYIEETRIVDSVYDFKKTLDAFMAVPYTDEIPESPVAIQGYHEIHLAIHALWEELYSLYQMDMVSIASASSNEEDEQFECEDQDEDDVMACEPGKTQASTTTTANLGRKSETKKQNRREGKSRDKTKSRHCRRKRKAGRSMRINRHSIRSKANRWDEMSNSGDDLPSVNKIKSKKDTSEDSMDLDKEFEQMDLVETSDQIEEANAGDKKKSGSFESGTSDKKDENHAAPNRNLDDRATDITFSPASSSGRPKKRQATWNKPGSVIKGDGESRVIVNVEPAVEGPLCYKQDPSGIDDGGAIEENSMKASSEIRAETALVPPPPPFMNTKAKDDEPLLGTQDSLSIAQSSTVSMVHPDAAKTKIVNKPESDTISILRHRDETLKTNPSCLRDTGPSVGDAKKHKDGSESMSHRDITHSTEHPIETRHESSKTVNQTNKERWKTKDVGTVDNVDKIQIPKDPGK